MEDDDWFLVDASPTSSPLPDFEAILVDPFSSIAGSGGLYLSSTSHPDSVSDHDDDDFVDPDEVRLDTIPRPDTLMQLFKLDVLPRLPVKSLLRFRAVSSDFNNWIRSPFFSYLSFRHAAINPISGFFFHVSSDSDPSYSPFTSSAALPSDTFSSFPEPVSVKASAHGLLCLRGRTTGAYYLSNPSTGDWTALPCHNADHGQTPAVAIVFADPVQFNFSMEFHIVVAFPVMEGVFSFQSFSSETWTWSMSDEVAAVEHVLPGTGTAAGDCAYWLTTMQVILEYEPRMDSSRRLRPPNSVALAVPEMEWQIGEMQGRLCVTAIGGGEVRVAALHKEKRLWKWIARFEAEGTRSGMLPLRAQGGSGELFVMELESRRVVAMDLHGKRLRSADGPVSGDEFIPYSSALTAVKRSPDDVIGQQPPCGRE